MPETPYLTIDLARVREDFGALQGLLPDAQIRYAVKANPAEPVLRVLAAAGAAFDVASVGEVDACAAAGIEGGLLSFGNPIQKPSAVARAWSRGVRRFAVDTIPGMATIAENTRGAGPECRIECRIAPAFPSSVTPFGHKFGCTPESAVRLLSRARGLGLRPQGICFHVGSQQLDPAAWDIGILAAARVFDAVGDLTTLNAGGGFPLPYVAGAPPLQAYTDAILAALERHFGGRPPRLVVEPGRVLVGSAGTIHSDLVSVRTGTDGRRWVYLDIGRYGGLAETENEYIRYRLTTDRDSDARAGAVVAGPTCDGDDVLYQDYALPVTLRPGDRVAIEDAGAYTASYSSTAFNGFPPLPTLFVEAPADATTAREITEALAPGLTRHWHLSEVLCEARTEYQHLVIGRTCQGIALFSDGERQSTELSQLVYHEALLIPGLLLADGIGRVLVIGSGEGVVSQLAVAAGARHVDHVDIDRQAVRLCAQHLPYGYTVDELRAAESGLGPVTMHYCDGWAFVSRRGPRYDLVVVDLPDERTPPAQHNRLYDVDFLERCRDIGAVVVAQAGCPTLWRNESLRRAWRRFHDVFDDVVYFGSDEHEWAFLSGLSGPSDATDPVTTMTARLPALPYRPQTIDAESLAGSTVPPKHLRANASGVTVSRQPPRGPGRIAPRRPATPRD